VLVLCLCTENGFFQKIWYDRQIIDFTKPCRNGILKYKGKSKICECECIQGFEGDYCQIRGSGKYESSKNKFKIKNKYILFKILRIIPLVNPANSVIL